MQRVLVMLLVLERELLLAALRVVPEGGFGAEHLGADRAGVVEDARKVLGLDVVADVGDRPVLEDSAERADPEGSLAGYVHVKVFRCREVRIVRVA